MKFTVYSDLHLEFDPTFRAVNTGADVLVLSGDIMVVDYLHKLRRPDDAIHKSERPKWERAVAFRDFVEDACRKFKHVVYVAGNHEHYHGRIETTSDYIREYLPYDNFYHLDNEHMDIGDVRIIGTTLWTDLNGNDPTTEIQLSYAMNDYRLIQVQKENYRKFQPKDSYRRHLKALEYIDAHSEHDKVVVVGHHAPTLKSIHERFKNDYYINGGYASNLSDFILDRPQIALWTHGHVHNCFDYQVGLTRVVANPKGYNDENPAFDPNHLVEVFK